MPNYNVRARSHMLWAANRRRVFESMTSEAVQLHYQGGGHGYVIFCYSSAGFLFLVFDSAPAALSQFFDPSLFDDFLPQALVGLLRGDVVDARMVVLRVVPGKVPIEIGDGLASSRNRPGYSGARFTVLKADSMYGLSLGVRGRANNWGRW